MRMTAIGFRRRTARRALALAAAAGATAALTLLPVAAPGNIALAAQFNIPVNRDLTRIENYLNGLTTVSARILQAGPDGSVAEGDFYLARPGRLRIQYDPPSPLLIVADGTWLNYYDAQLKQAERMRIESTPASVVVRPHIRFGDGINVTEYKRKDETIRVTLENAREPGSGSLTLVFSDSPLLLRQWVVIDPDGRETKVTFTQFENGVKLDERFFEFKNYPLRNPAG